MPLGILVAALGVMHPKGITYLKALGFAAFPDPPKITELWCFEVGQRVPWKVVHLMQTMNHLFG
jgi:hypothetical protein